MIVLFVCLFVRLNNVNTKDCNTHTAFFSGGSFRSIAFCFTAEFQAGKPRAVLCAGETHSSAGEQRLALFFVFFSSVCACVYSCAFLATSVPPRPRPAPPPPVQTLPPTPRPRCDAKVKTKEGASVPQHSAGGGQPAAAAAAVSSASSQRRIDQVVFEFVFCPVGIFKTSGALISGP